LGRSEKNVEQIAAAVLEEFTIQLRISFGWKAKLREGVHELVKRSIDPQLSSPTITGQLHHIPPAQKVLTAHRNDTQGAENQPPVRQRCPRDYSDYFVGF
jgi:hypothetical protein